MFRFLTIFVQELKCSQWWGFIVWFQLGDHIVWYPHGYEVFEGAVWVCLHGPSDNRSTMSRPNRLCWPFRLHGPITDKTTIWQLNIIHFSCIVSLLQKNLCTHVREYIAQLFYIMLWYEQKCVIGNMLKNNMVYCQISECTYFVLILRGYIFFNTTLNLGRGRWLWYGRRLLYRYHAA